MGSYDTVEMAGGGEDESVRLKGSWLFVIQHNYGRPRA